MAKYRIMAILETGEEHCFADNFTAKQAEKWLKKNRDQYPELGGLWPEEMRTEIPNSAYFLEN